MEVDAAVQELVAANESLEVVTVAGANDAQVVRVKCSATGHEMPPRVDVITAHINSKRFKKATEWYSYDFSQYEPYIVSHRRKPKCLYCNVTGIVLNKIPAEVEKHMAGKKFQRLKEEVKFFNEDEAGKEDDDFDANKFEFLNRQLVDSDAEDEDEDDEAAPKKRKTVDEGIGEEFYEGLPPVSDDEDEADDAEVEDKEEEDEEEEEEEEEVAKKPKLVSKKDKPSPKKAAEKPASKGFQKISSKLAAKKAAPANKRQKK
ncbi:hypothetical protein ACHHYP_01712 [Achlya hypogyna]|uniref:Surfeit locus protein 2 n=1 Tax=Achlya hypogyna TaxID=1202772 RepID=A0A1V9ZT28_ACHHY|nr:hypothetical protein ACHHYP_01712 [Achlya hypogyna]